MKPIVLALFVFCFYTASGQNTAITKAFSAGAELGLPTGGVYNVGIGGAVKFELPIVSPVSFTITGGYMAMFYKSALIGSSRKRDAATFIPLKAGLKYYFAQTFYVEGEAGSAIETNYNKHQSFVFAIGPGFVIPLNSGKQALDLGFRYENWTGQLRETGIRFAYRFGL